MAILGIGCIAIGSTAVARAETKNDLAEPSRKAPATGDHEAPPKAPGSAEKHEAGIELTSDPAGATVYLDGAWSCKTPCTLKNKVLGKARMLALWHRGYRPWGALLPLARLTGGIFEARLRKSGKSPKIGYLLLQVRPRADVMIDEQPVHHVTSQGRLALAAGTHQVTLSRPDREQRMKLDVDIHPGRTTTIRKGSW